MTNTALDAYRAAGDGVGESLTLYNLATLLRGRPGRLADIRRHAEQALAIQRTLDPAAAEIWETYKILADVADAEGRADEARTYRRQGRQSFAASSVSRKWLRQYAPLISAVAAAAADPAQRPALETRLDCMMGRGDGQLIAALRRLLDGERDKDALTDALNPGHSLIVATALRALADRGLQAETLPWAARHS